MKTGNKKNNKLNEKNNLSVQATGSVQETAKRKRGRPSKAAQQQQQSVSVSAQDNTEIKKRGRPKGSKNKAIRKDNVNLVKPNQNNSVFIRYSLELSSLPAIDVNNIQQMQTRITEYFAITEQYALKAAVSSLALAFHVDRVTLFNWLNRRTETIKNQECFNTLKKAYNIICSQYEYMLNNGTINPVSGIFLMKNNFGYKDNTELNITANQDKQETISDITNRANLLD